LAAWALLHAGTLWLNAALDRDEGEVLLGRAVPVPVDIVPWGYAALVAAVGVAWSAAAAIGLACAGCAVLAVLYSHPRFAWKAHPLGGPVVNALGYGLLSPFAGFAAAGVAPDKRSVAVWILGAVGVLGAYFAAQAFQQAEDSARGYRTLVVTHGPVACLQAARVCVAVGLVGAVALAVAGWLPRVCLVCLPLHLWVDAHFRAWIARGDGGDESWARELARRLLWAGLLALAVTAGEYVSGALAGEPVAGLGTAAGHPPDRPRLPPLAMRRWEAQQAALADPHGETPGRSPASP
jgi:hypothetical protein